LAIIAGALNASAEANEPPKAAADSAKIETYEAEEIAHLEELVKSAERVFGRVDALKRNAVRGGEFENWAQARRHLAVARARLALAKGDPKEGLRQRTMAVEAAKENIDALEAAYDAGTQTLDVVLTAQNDLADAKIQLSKLQRKLRADKQDSKK
jgi:hypothetical protein